MAYLRHTDAEQIDPETVRLLAGVVGLTIPDEDLAPLSAALADQLAAIDLLSRLDLTDVAPILSFDPRWHDESA